MRSGGCAGSGRALRLDPFAFCYARRAVAGHAVLSDRLRAIAWPRVWRTNDENSSGRRWPIGRAPRISSSGPRRALDFPSCTSRACDDASRISSDSCKGWCSYSRRNETVVRFTLESGHVQCTHRCPLRANSGHCERNYSITASARVINVGGSVRPRTLAVVRLMTNSNVVGCWTGRSPGFAPRRILSTYSAACRNKSK